jgi:valacyclovir hydrolase
MPKIDLADFAIHFEMQGAGSPILFLPGALGTGHGDFSEQLAFFGKFFQAISPDPRGYGRSRPPLRDYPSNFYERDAEDMLALMTLLGHQRFMVIGWSDGANIGALLAAKHPERITRLVMWGGNSFLTKQELEIFQSMQSTSAWSPRALEAMRSIYGDTLQALWESYLAALQELFGRGADIYRSRLHLIRCPTLILHGAKDPLVPSLHPAILQQGIAASQLYIFPEGKHNIHQKYAGEFNQRVLGFLEG